MLSLSDVRDLVRAEAAYIDPPEGDWEDEEAWLDEVDREVEEYWFERRAEHDRN